MRWIILCDFDLLSQIFASSTNIELDIWNQYRIWWKLLQWNSNHVYDQFRWIVLVCRKVNHSFYLLPITMHNSKKSSNWKENMNMYDQNHQWFWFIVFIWIRFHVNVLWYSNADDDFVHLKNLPSNQIW